MASLEDLTQRATDYTKKLDEVRAIVKKYIFPKEGSEQSKDPVKMADAIFATEVIVTIVNLFVYAHTFNTIAGSLSHSDLLFGLNANHFWVRHQNYLMPLIQISYNAMQDFHLNKAKKLYHLEAMKERLEYDKILWTYICPVIVGILYGYNAMRASSDEFKASIEAIYKELITY